MTYARPKPTIAWIDVSKGVGIYLVVLGHANINPRLQQFIYLFHMPLFFFLSGYLHIIKTDCGAFCRKKVIHLLLPYASFLLLLYPFELVRILLHHRPGHPITHAILAALWGGSKLQGLYGVFWFLPCLFLTQQLMNFMLAKFRLRTVIGLVSVALLLSYCNAQLMPWFNLPLNANVVLGAMPFFLMGLLAARFRWDRRISIAVSFTGAAIGVYLNHLSMPLFYDMRDGVYGIPGLSLILAACCIGCMIFISKAAARFMPIRKVLAGIGASSVGIMFIHKVLPAVPHLNAPALRHGYLATDVFVVISFAVTWLLGRATVTRAFLLGSERDFYNLFDSSVLVVRRNPPTGESENLSGGRVNEMA